MTRRPAESGLPVGFLALIGLTFWIVPAAGAANNAASYSLTQAAEGRVLYTEHCASCHGPNLLGNESGPALSGKAFQDRWAKRPVGQLFDDVDKIACVVCNRDCFKVTTNIPVYEFSAVPIHHRYDTFVTYGKDFF